MASQAPMNVDPEVGKVSGEYQASIKPLNGSSPTTATAPSSGMSKKKKGLIIGGVLGTLALVGVAVGVGVSVSNQNSITTTKSVNGNLQDVPVAPVQTTVAPVIVPNVPQTTVAPVQTTIAPVEVTPTPIPAPVEEKPAPVQPAPQDIQQADPTGAKNNQIKGKYVVYGNIPSEQAVRSHDPLPQVKPKEPNDWPADLKIVSPWYCVKGVTAPVVKLSDGNVACASFDGKSCLWQPNDESCFILLWQGTTNSPGMIPNRCTGHGDPTSWCGKGYAALATNPPNNIVSQNWVETTHDEGAEVAAYPFPQFHRPANCNEWGIFQKDYHHYSPLRINANGDVECIKTNGVGCMWGHTLQQGLDIVNNLDNLLKTQGTFDCGPKYQAAYNGEDPMTTLWSWCNIARHTMRC